MTYASFSKKKKKKNAWVLFFFAKFDATRYIMFPSPLSFVDIVNYWWSTQLKNVIVNIIVHKSFFLDFSKNF